MSKVELKLKLELLSISGRSAFPFGIFFHFGKQFGNLKFKIWEIRISVWERIFQPKNVEFYWKKRTLKGRSAIDSSFQTKNSYFSK